MALTSSTHTCRIKRAHYPLKMTFFNGQYSNPTVIFNTETWKTIILTGANYTVDYRKIYLVSLQYAMVIYNV